MAHSSWRVLGLTLSICFGMIALCHTTAQALQEGQSPSGGCCPNACSGHGNCKTMDQGCVCTCSRGWQGGDCSERVCPSAIAWTPTAENPQILTNYAHVVTECSNRGICDRKFGRCLCQDGFAGTACDRLACPQDCSGHGQCQSMKYHATLKDPGAGTVYKYDTVWDAEKVYGCACDVGYSGSDCSLRDCPLGDDPLTGTPDDTVFLVQSNERQQIVCTASGGTFALSFRRETTEPIPFDANEATIRTKLEQLSNIEKVDVRIQQGVVACTAIGSSNIVIEFLTNFGPLQLLVTDTRRLTHTQAPTMVVSRLVTGTKESLPCSGRGLCDTTTGVCHCYEGYKSSDGTNTQGTRGDCGAVAPLLVERDCPTIDTSKECSGHGLCLGQPTFRCQCETGWTGGDCNLRMCPYGLSWFDYPVADQSAHTTYTECSDKGQCDRTTGNCLCNVGFGGAACDRLRCPSMSNQNECSGNGRCLPMSELVRLATKNGDPAGITYGTDPNNPRTWDGHRVYGCLCDDRWTGYDCSQRKCPAGDNPRTGQQVDEVQVIQCTASTGTFTLTFRRFTTVVLAWDASASAMEAALEALPTIGDVSVEYSQGSTACTANGANKISIQFNSELGNLPPLTAQIISGIASMNIFVDGTGAGGVLSVSGTKENDECSAQGLCERATGVCHCFPGLVSSDGNGNLGLRGDCGAVDTKFQAIE